MSHIHKQVRMVHRSEIQDVFLTNLHKKVEQPKEGDDDSHKWCGKQDDETGTQHVEHGSHEHFNNTGDSSINGVHLLGKAIDQVATWGFFKEGHG